MGTGIVSVLSARTPRAAESEVDKRWTRLNQKQSNLLTK